MAVPLPAIRFFCNVSSSYSNPVIACTTFRPITWRFPQHENLGRDMGVGVILAGVVVAVKEQFITKSLVPIVFSFTIFSETFYPPFGFSGARGCLTKKRPLPHW